MGLIRAAAGLDEGFEQFGGQAVRKRGMFGMPLDAKNELGTGMLDRFNDSVGRPGGNPEAGGFLLDRLMVKAVDLDLFCAGNAMKKRAFQNGDLVAPMRSGSFLGMLDRGMLRTQILI